MAAPPSAQVFHVGTWLRSRAALEGSTHVSAPREVGCYSRDNDRTITYGSRAELKRFREPPPAAVRTVPICFLPVLAWLVLSGVLSRRFCCLLGAPVRSRSSNGSATPSLSNTLTVSHAFPNPIFTLAPPLVPRPPLVGGTSLVFFVFFVISAGGRSRQDLYAGFATFVPKETAGAPVEPIIRAARAAAFPLERDADFVTYRNNLNKLMLVPYAAAAGGDDWHIHAVLVGATVFLDVVPWEERSPHLAAARAAYSGVKFEALCTAPPPTAADAAADGGGDAVNANAEFCSLVRLRVGRHRLLMSAEIDCYEPTPPGAPPSASTNVLTGYRELKTMAVPRTPAQHARVKGQRLLKYWIQSYLAGVPELFLGFRSDRGELTGTMRVPTRALPDLAAAPGDALLPPPGWDPDGPGGGGGRPPWEPWTCVNALDALLDAIRSQCEAAGNGVPVRLSFASVRGVVTREACPDEEFGERVRAALARSDADDGGGDNREGS